MLIFILLFFTGLMIINSVLNLFCIWVSDENRDFFSEKNNKKLYQKWLVGGSLVFILIVLIF